MDTGNNLATSLDGAQSMDTVNSEFNFIDQLRELESILGDERNKTLKIIIPKIRDYFNKIYGVLIDMDRMNCKLRVENQVTKNFNMELLKVIESYPTTPVIKDLPDGTSTFNTVIGDLESSRSGPSYAEKVYDKVPVILKKSINAKVTNVTRELNGVTDGTNLLKSRRTNTTLLLFPKENCPTDIDMETILRSQVDLCSTELGVVSIKKLASRGLAVQLHSEDDMLKLGGYIENCLKLKDIMMVRKSRKNEPRVIIFNVEGSLDREEVRRHLIAQNKLVDVNTDLNKTADVEVLYSIPSRRSDAKHWVIQTSWMIYDCICKSDKLKIGWRMNFFKLFISVLRCFNCQRYGHVQKHCKRTSPTCVYCAGDHKGTACEEVIRKCINCSSVPHSTDIDVASHAANDKVCPIYIRERSRLEAIGYSN